MIPDDKSESDESYMEVDYETSEDDEDYEDIDENETGDNFVKQPSKAGRKLKPFVLNKRTQQRAKLRDPYIAIENAAKKLGISFLDLLGHLGKMYCNTELGYNASDKSWLELFTKISNGQNPLEEHSISVEQAIYLSENVVKGRTKWDKLRNCLLPVIKLPSNDALKKFRKKFHPKLGKAFSDHYHYFHLAYHLTNH